MKNIKIGMRNVKTFISVFIALFIYIFLYIIDSVIGKETDEFLGLTAIYTPFFGAIAAAYTSHRDYKSSLKHAKIRSVGSVIGGYFGMILIMLVEYFFLTLFPIDNYLLYKTIEFFVVALGIIPLIYLGVVVKQTDVTFISCLTYLSVTISVRNGGMGIAQFATNRILSTLIGVGIALLVNNFKIHYKTNKNLLFIASIDNVINYSDYPLSFTRYKLNDLYQRDAKLVLHTKRSGLDDKLFYDVNINMPMILMDGVCIYDDKSKNYIYSCDFLQEIKEKLNNYFYKNNYDVFTYVIHDLRLVCHYKNLSNDVSKAYYEHERINNNYPFVYADVIDSCDVAMYEVIINEDDYQEFLNDLKTLQLIDSVKIKIKHMEDTGFLLARIKPLNCNWVDTVMHLSYYDKYDTKIIFINHIGDLTLARDNDFKICLSNADEEIKKECDYIINSNDFNDVLKLFGKIYYAKNLSLYLNRLKKKKF